MNNAVDPRTAVGLPQSLPGGRATRLQNVHVGVKSAPVAGGTVHMIEGNYDYHHYMQVCGDHSSFTVSYVMQPHTWFAHCYIAQVAADMCSTTCAVATASLNSAKVAAMRGTG